MAVEIINSVDSPEGKRIIGRVVRPLAPGSGARVIEPAILNPHKFVKEKDEWVRPGNARVIARAAEITAAKSAFNRAETLYYDIQGRRGPLRITDLENSKLDSETVKILRESRRRNSPKPYETLFASVLDIAQVAGDALREVFWGTDFHGLTKERKGEQEKELQAKQNRVHRDS